MMIIDAIIDAIIMYLIIVSIMHHEQSVYTYNSNTCTVLTRPGLLSSLPLRSNIRKTDQDSPLVVGEGRQRP